MRNHTRDLLSIPALAIAAIAISATSAHAQCPGGCFGYPTPSRPVMQTFAPAVHYQPAVQMVPTQRFVHAVPFVSAPQYAPIESFAPVQSFVQPQQFAQPQFAQPQFAQPQFAPMMAAPIEQTFVAQPAIIQPMQMIGTPESFPQPLGTSFPTNSYPLQTGVIESGQMMGPVIFNSTDPISSPIVDPATTEDMGAESLDNEQVQEGQIEGEIISQPNDASDLEVMPGTIDGPDNETSSKQGNVDNLLGDLDKFPLLSEEQQKRFEEAQKAEKEKAAKEKAAKERAAKRKANRLEAEKAKAAELESEKKKAKTKVETNAEKITRLETSITRQIKRAKQVSKRNLDKKLAQLKADDASDADITSAEEEAADALEAKIESIEKRIQARIDQLKK